MGVPKVLIPQSNLLIESIHFNKKDTLNEVNIFEVGMIMLYIESGRKGRKKPLAKKSPNKFSFLSWRLPYPKDLRVLLARWGERGSTLTLATLEGSLGRYQGL